MSETGAAQSAPRCASVPSATGTAVPAGSSTRPAGSRTSSPPPTRSSRPPATTVAASGNVARTGSRSVTVSPPVRRARVVAAEHRGALGQPAEVQQQQAGGQRDRERLEPVLERLHVGDAAHPAERHVERHDAADRHHADPVGRVDDLPERQAGALELGHEVEAADQQHDRGRQRPQRRRAQPRLGEVGDRVGAEAAQRRGDEQQQREVAGGEPQRQPERARAELHLQPGDAEERGRRQVLARDRRRVPPGRHRARRDEQVRRRARAAARRRRRARSSRR